MYHFIPRPKKKRQVKTSRIGLRRFRENCWCARLVRVFGQEQLDEFQGLADVLSVHVPLSLIPDTGEFVIKELIADRYCKRLVETHLTERTWEGREGTRDLLSGTLAMLKHSRIGGEELRRPGFELGNSSTLENDTPS